MGFFARPRLSNEQFVQHTDDILTLTGQTQIATPTGLTLVGDSGYIPVTASGATIADFDVLTYCQGVISLLPSAASGGTNIYDGTSPTTCTVGGLPSGTPISGDTVNNILQCILVPTLDPVTTAFFNSLTLSPSGTYEVGDGFTVCATSCFDRGNVNPQYCGGSPYLAGLPSSHIYCAFGNFTTPTTATTTNLCSCVEYNPTIQLGNNTVYSCVNYSSGDTPVYKSDGTVLCTTPAGATSNQSKTISGVYPWYWGNSVSAPDISTSGCTQCLLDSCVCKCVASSSGSITVDNYSVTGEYIWFAIPTGYTKTCWQGANNVSNNGFIPGTLFPAPTNWNVDSTESCWSGVGYGFYVSNYATNIDYGMTFCN